MTVKYLCKIPTLPGHDLCHPTRTSAEREAANARRQGHEAEIVEVLVR